jgi:glycosyltransferase involved in cell wall biosynthesis
MSVDTGRAGQMKILLVSLRGCPPYLNAQSYRIAKIAKFLRKAGNEVTIVGHRLQSSTVIDNRLMEDMNSFGQVPIVMIGKNIVLARTSSSSRILNMLGAPDDFVFSMPTGLRELKKIISAKDIECIITSNAPTSYILGSLITQDTEISWIADLADLWTDAPGHDAATRFHRSWRRQIERKMLSQSDGISYVSESWESMLRGRYPAIKLCHIPNGFDSEEFKPSNPTKLSHQGLVFCFIGTIYRDMDLVFLKAFVDFMEKTPSANKSVKLKILGAIAPKKRNEIADLCEFNGNIEIRGFLPHFDMIGEVMDSDFLIYDLGTRGTAKYDTLPSRLPIYIGSGKPTIACSLPGSFVDRLLRKFGCWRIVDSNKKDDIERCFEEAWELFSSGTDIGNLKTWNGESDSLHWDNIVEHFNRFIKEVQG